MRILYSKVEGWKDLSPIQKRIIRTFSFSPLFIRFGPQEVVHALYEALEGYRDRHVGIYLSQLYHYLEERWSRYIFKT